MSVLKYFFMVLTVIVATGCSDGKDGAPGAKGSQGETGAQGEQERGQTILTKMPNYFS